MDNEMSLLTDMQQEDCKLYGTVEIDQLRSVWKARKFVIQVPDSLVKWGLLPSIFDWQFLGQLMPTDQATGEMMLQQRINDLELMNSLITSLQRIQFIPEAGVEVAMIMGRPSYKVQVQDDGSILVKEQPSVHIHIFSAETFRAVAGQECMLAEASEHSEQLAGTRQQFDESNNDAAASNQMPVQNDMQPSAQHFNLVDSKTFTNSKNSNDHQNESEEPTGTRIRHRWSRWTRFSNWLHQKIPRLTRKIKNDTPI